MVRSAKVLERMVNLNTFDEIAQDFRFWEDACDEYKENEGTEDILQAKLLYFCQKALFAFSLPYFLWEFGIRSIRIKSVLIEGVVMCPDVSKTHGFVCTRLYIRISFRKIMFSPLGH